MEITWKINQLDRNTANGFVTTAHWTCSGTDGDFSGSVYASCGFDGELSAGTPIFPIWLIEIAKMRLLNSFMLLPWS